MRWYHRIGFVIVLLAGFALRFWHLGHASLWIDEIWTDYWTQASLLKSLDLILEIGNQTPLYFTLLHFFPNDTELMLRLPSALMGGIGIALIIRVVAQLWKDYDAALFAGALVAFNPYHIWLSRMARPYPLVFILSLLTSYYFLRLLRGERSRRMWTAFAVASTAAYMTHYFTIALPLAQYALFAFVLKRNRRFFRQWIWIQGLAAVPVLIWIYALSKQEAVAFGIGWIPRPGVPDLFLTLWNMTAGYDGHLYWYVLPALVLLLGGLVAGSVWVVRHYQTEREKLYWFLLFILTFIFGFAVSLFRPLYVDRYFMVTLPALVLLIILGWKSLVSRRWQYSIAGIVVVMSLVSVIVTLDTGRDQKEDWRSAADYIEREWQSGDGLLTESPIELLSILHYADDDPLDYAWLLEAPDPMTQYDEPVSRIWAVYRNPREDGHRQGVLADFDPYESSGSPMPLWLTEHHVVMQKEFNGVTVLLVDVSEETP